MFGRLEADEGFGGGWEGVGVAMLWVEFQSQEDSDEDET